MPRKLFEDFDFSLLTDSRFKEESVREELIAPLIRDLGYSNSINSKNTQVIRNHGLKHPFVSIGSSRKKITVIPDYLLLVSEKPAWILEAKSPFEDITDTKHVEQAYSYAIHPEVRVNYFALCNGHHFIVYDINRPQPLFHISLKAIELYRGLLKELLSPLTILSFRDFNLNKDLGLHMKRLGFKNSDSTLIVDLKPLMILKYNDDLFSFTAPVSDGTTTYLGTFDFDLRVAQQLRAILGEADFLLLLQPIETMQLQFNLNREIRVNVRISLPEAELLVENEKEIFLPLSVSEFIFL